jgi:glutathione S-transferase
VPRVTPHPHTFPPPLPACPFPQTGYTDARGAPTPGDSSLDCNLGRLPALVTADGATIGQSSAINSYVAGVTGLNGATPVEAAQILAFSEHLKELDQAYRKLCPYGTEPTEAANATFFDSNDATDFAGPADGAKRDARNLLWFMGRMERLVGDGFAVGGKISLADVLIYRAFGDSLSEAQANEGLPAHRREPFGSLARVNAALGKHPKLAKIVASVAAHPNIAKWLATRGKQGF